MRRNKITLSPTVRRSLRQPVRLSATSENSLDSWLVRLSHLSQFGLFALTIAALYFTVIPLYKTAALEEGIAKREAELRDTENRLAAAEKVLTEVTERSYVRERGELINSFIRRAGVSCSGLLRPPEPLLKIGEKRAEKVLLDIDVGRCLNSELEQLASAGKLRPADHQALADRVNSLGQSLEKRRLEAQKQIEAVPASAVGDRSTWAEKGHYEKEFDEFAVKAKRVLPNANWEKIELENAIRRTQRTIANAFEESVRREVSSLKSSITWSASKN